MNRTDARGLDVYQCYDRRGWSPWFLLTGFDHTWVETDSYEWGVEPRKVGDSWFYHAIPEARSGRYDYSDPQIDCQPRLDVSEMCVDNALKASGDQGVYYPFINACDDYAHGVLSQCQRPL